MARTILSELASEGATEAVVDRYSLPRPSDSSRLETISQILKEDDSENKRNAHMKLHAATLSWLAGPKRKSLSFAKTPQPCILRGLPQGAGSASTAVPCLP